MMRMKRLQTKLVSVTGLILLFCAPLSARNQDKKAVERVYWEMILSENECERFKMTCAAIQGANMPRCHVPGSNS